MCNTWTAMELFKSANNDKKCGVIEARCRRAAAWTLTAAAAAAVAVVNVITAIDI